jgi:hypothetical protein
MWVPLMTAADLVEWLAVLDDRDRPVLDEAGKPTMRPRPVYTVNCLRHFAASLMIDQGMSPKKVQKRMGHSSIQVTFDLYGHLFDRKEADSDEIARIERDMLGSRIVREPNTP